MRLSLAESACQDNKTPVNDFLKTSDDTVWRLPPFGDANIRRSAKSD